MSALSDSELEALKYSRPYDVHFRSDHPDANSLVDVVWALLSSSPTVSGSRGGPKPKSSYEDQFRVLLLNLFVNWKMDPALRTGVPMTTSYYSTNWRFKKLRITALTMDLVRLMVDLGLLQLWKGVESRGMQSRIWPTDELVDYFKRAPLSLFDVDGSPEGEEIVLNKKDVDGDGVEFGDAHPIDYDDSDYPPIPVMRSELKRYNELLRVSFIDVGTSENYVISHRYWDKKRNAYWTRFVPVTQHNKFVRRIFYRGSWELGGRFHGGFWQQIGEPLRADILINDKETIELDYSGLHINLCYGVKKIQPLTREDPYELELEFGLTADEQRSVVKVLSLAAINADEETKAFSATRHKMETGHPGKKLIDAKLRVLLDSFKAKHPDISDMICTDKGVELMKIDGNITARVINHFSSKGVVVLSVHDSYIVPQQHVSELKEVMNDAIAAELDGLRIRIDQDKKTINEALTGAFVSPAQLRDRGPYSIEHAHMDAQTRRTRQYDARKKAHYDWLDSL